MDFAAFYRDVVDWIGRVNQQATRIGMDHADFWPWVVASCGEICRKYQDHRLVIMQMIMLIEWLEEVYESRKGGERSN